VSATRRDATEGASRESIVPRRSASIVACYSGFVNQPLLSAISAFGHHLEEGNEIRS
jgi:hypothetical protein